jgi:hypothetical protein
MILRSPLSIPPNPLAGPRRIGDQTDYIELDPANGQIDTAGAASPLTVNNLQLDLWQPPRSGEYTTGLFNSSKTNGGSPPADRIVCVPCVLPKKGIYSHLCIWVETPQADSNARMGIYSAATDGRPGALIEEAATFTPTANALYEAAFSADRALGPGFYWLALLHDNSSIAWQRSHVFGSLILTLLNSVSALYPSAYEYKDQAYGPLPASLDGSTAAPVNSYPPRIGLKGA